MANQIIKHQSFIRLIHTWRYLELDIFIEKSGMQHQSHKLSPGGHLGSRFCIFAHHCHINHFILECHVLLNVLPIGFNTLVRHI
ncbi:hypothetical protein D3C80_1619650 [compost metagenome]